LKSKAMRILARAIALTIVFSVLGAAASTLPQFAFIIFFYAPAMTAATAIASNDFPLLEFLAACVIQNLLVALFVSALWEARRKQEAPESVPGNVHPPV